MTDAPSRLRARLRSDLEISRQRREDGMRVFVKDPRTGKIFLFPEPAFAILGALNEEASVEDVLRRLRPGSEPSAQLVASAQALIDKAQAGGLLAGDSCPAPPPGSPSKFDPLSWKVAMINPQWLLRVTAPLGRVLFSTGGAIIWAAALLAAGLRLAAHTHYLALMTAKTAIPPLSVWSAIYVLFFAATCAHELGHAMACHRYGIKVREIGVMFYLVQVAAYCNITDACIEPSRRKRISISLAGMYFEGFLWSAAILTWSFQPPGSPVSQTAFGLSTLILLRMLVNLIPLFSCDGYFLLSDLMDIPNLRARAFAYCRSLLGSRAELRERTVPRPHAIVFIVYALSAVVITASIFAYVAVVCRRYVVHKYPQHGEVGFWICAALAVYYLAWRYLFGAGGLLGGFPGKLFGTGSNTRA